jgi:hypothetical protein
MKIYNINENIPFCEAQGLAICFQAYADNSPSEEILSIGFNNNSGYIYIALENGVQICSMLGQGVEYIVTDYRNGEEYFFDTYKEALSYISISLTDED